MNRITYWVCLLSALGILISVLIFTIGAIRKPKELKVTYAQYEKITDVIVAEGRVVPEEQVTVSTNLRARIDSICVDVGDPVEQGQILAQLEQDQYANLVSQAQILRDNLQKNFENASVVLERQEKLFAQGVIPKTEVEKIRVSYADIKSELEKAEANLALHKLQLANTTIVSPITGLVSARLANPGEMVRGALFTIDSPQVSFMALIDEEKTGRVQEGKATEVVLSAFPGEVFHGVVEKINPTIGVESRNIGFPIWASLPELPLLMPGLRGYVKILTPRTALVIPTSALIFFSGEQALVFVVEDSKAHVRPVVFGTSSDGKTEIVKGLDAYEQVVVDGHEKLEDGSKVTIAY